MNTKIKKRDGRLVKFNADKITNAIAKACAATGEFDMKEARKLTIKVLNLTEQLFNGKNTVRSFPSNEKGRNLYPSDCIYHPCQQRASDEQFV